MARRPKKHPKRSRKEVALADIGACQGLIIMATYGGWGLGPEHIPVLERAIDNCKRILAEED